jgi:hypothetical protein
MAIAILLFNLYDSIIDWYRASDVLNDQHAAKRSSVLWPDDSWSLSIDQRVNPSIGARVNAIRTEDYELLHYMSIVALFSFLGRCERTSPLDSGLQFPFPVAQDPFCFR